MNNENFPMPESVFRETEHGKRETVFLVKELKSEGVKEFFSMDNEQ